MAVEGLVGLSRSVEACFGSRRVEANLGLSRRDEAFGG